MTHLRTSMILALLLAGFVIPAGAARAAFEPAFDISDTGNAIYVDAATDSSGTVHFAWQDGVGLHTRTRSPDGTLGPVLNLSSAGSEFQVVADATGGVRFVWRTFDGFNYRIRSRRLGPDGLLEPATYVSPGGFNSFYPDVAADGSGGAAFIWERYTGAGNVVEARRIAADGSLGPIQALSQEASVVDQRIATTAVGDVVAIWGREMNGYVVAEARRWEASGALGPLVSLSEPAAHASNPRVGLDAAGNAVLAYEYGEELVIRRLSAGGDLSEAKDVRKQPIDHIGSFELAVAPHGDAQIVWSVKTGGEPEIQTRRRFSDGALGAIQGLASAADVMEPLPQVAFDSRGHAHHLWIGMKFLDAFDSDPVAMARTRMADGTLGPLQELSAPMKLAGGEASGPVLVESANGRPVAGWLRTNEAGEKLVQGAILADDLVGGGGSGGTSRLSSLINLSKGT